MKTKEQEGKGMSMETRNFMDSLVAAFLDLKGFTVRAKKLDSGRVAFDVTGEGIDKALENFYENEKVPVANFCASYRNIRSMMFAAKGV